MKSIVLAIVDRNIRTHSYYDCGPDMALSFNNGHLSIKGPEVDLDLDQIQEFALSIQSKGEQDND